jgi:hypothetical protein
MFVMASSAEASTACLDRSAVGGWDSGERQVVKRPFGDSLEQAPNDGLRLRLDLRMLGKDL